VSRYAELAERRPKMIRDWSERWNELSEVATANDVTAERVAAFCERKGVSLDALTALGARVATHRQRSCLAFAGWNRDGSAVVAIKYRPLDGSSDESEAEKPSTWMRPIVLGNQSSLDWFIAEGETDAARLYDLVGDAAAIVVLPTGALARFKLVWAERIPRGATIYLCQTRTWPGDAGAEKARRALGVAVRLRPPETDWCDWRGTREEFVQLVQDARKAAGTSSAWLRLSEIEMRSIVFLDRPLWQASAFHLVVGRKGVGKGTMLSDLGARVTRGELGTQRNVVWIASEDSAAIDIKPRLVAAGGDPECVFIRTEWLQLPRDVSVLSSARDEIGDVGLVVVDPVGNHITGKDSNSETDIRDAIAPLNGLADELETMIVGVRHLTEKECKSGALAAILGSSAWVQVPRAVIGMARDNEDARISHVQCLSGNRLPPETPGRTFRIEGVLLEGLENEVTAAVWTGESTKNVETLIGETRKEPSKSEAARELILDVLDDAPGRHMESDELDARVARETGLAAQTIRNLRAGLKKDGLIRPVPVKDDAGQVQRWLIERTNAPRSDETTVIGDPVTVSEDETPEFGSTTPEPVQEPTHPLTVTGLNQEPVTETLDVGDLAVERFR
jgi:AAA domain